MSRPRLTQVSWIVAAIILAGAFSIVRGQTPSTSTNGEEQSSRGVLGGVLPDKGADEGADEGAKGSEEGAKDGGPTAVSAADHRGDKLMASLTIFVLAIFVGFEIITKVPPTLHTPLMSGSNAISGITVVGAILVGGAGLGFSGILGLFAVALASINVVGGFLVTHRMLSMFRKH